MPLGYPTWNLSGFRVKQVTDIFFSQRGFEGPQQKKSTPLFTIGTIAVLHMGAVQRYVCCVCVWRHRTEYLPWGRNA